MGIIENIKNKITGADKTPKQRYDEDIAKRQKRFDKILKEKAARQKMQGECAAVLDECRTAFSSCINTERARSRKKRIDGYDTSTEEARIREAAIGILIVDEAKYKLQAVSSESDLNMAMNRLGMALRQLRRMDNSSTAVSASTERILEDWCPGLVAESGDLTLTKLEVPAEMRSRIDDDFVSDLVTGNDYATAMKMRSYRKPAAQRATAQAAPQVSSASSMVDDIMRKAYGSGEKEQPEDISDFKYQV